MISSLHKIVNGNLSSAAVVIASRVCSLISSLFFKWSISSKTYSMSSSSVNFTWIVGDHKKSLWKICKTCSNILFFFFWILVKFYKRELSGKVYG